MNLKPEQVSELYRLFPRVESYINHCLIQNEYRYLKDNEYILNDWQKTRLAELRGYEEQFDRDFYNDQW